MQGNGFTGQSAFDAALRAARDVARTETRAVVAKTAQELVKRVQAATPMGDPRNGHIRDSVKATQVDQDTWKVEIGGAAQPYAAALEFGHAAPDGSRVPAQKVFFPSVRIMNRKFGRAIRRVIRKAIRNGGIL